MNNFRSIIVGHWNLLSSFKLLVGSSSELRQVVTVAPYSLCETSFAGIISYDQGYDWCIQCVFFLSKVNPYLPHRDLFEFISC